MGPKRIRVGALKSEMGSADEQGMSGRAAMVVDDDPRFRRSLGRLLTEQGYTVALAESAASAVDALGKGLPDLMFIDLEMPGARGDRLVRALRKMRHDLPIVVCSGTANRDDLVMLVQAGISDFLPKPFGRVELVACLDRLAVRSPKSTGLPREGEPTSPHRSRERGEERHPRGKRGDQERLPAREIQPRERAMAPATLLRRAALAEEAIPTMSPRMGAVNALMEQPDIGVTEVVAVLETDPGVVGALLRVCRAPAFASLHPPKTIREACVVLGNRTALCIAHEAFAASLGVKEGPFAQLSHATWRNAIATAHVARLLVTGSDDLDPEMAFLVGLFHNVGDAVLLQSADRLWREGHQAKPETVLDLSSSLHERLGGALCKKWGLATAVTSVASAHHGVADRPQDRDTRGYATTIRTAHHLATAWVGQGLHPASPPTATVEELSQLEERWRDTVLSLMS